MAEKINMNDFHEISRKISNNQFESIQEMERFAAWLVHIYKESNNAAKKDLLIKIYLSSKEPYLIKSLIHRLGDIVSSDIIIQFYQLLKDLGAVNYITEAFCYPNSMITEEIEDFVVRTIAETRKMRNIRPLFSFKDHVNREKLTEAVVSTGDIKFITEYSREYDVEMKDAQILELYRKTIESGNPKNIYWFMKTYIYIYDETMILNSVKKLKEIGASKEIYDIIDLLELMSMENINIFNALVQALIDLGDFKYISLLIKRKKDFVQRNGYVNQLFIAIIKSLEIETLPEVKIENILVKFAEAGVFDINILVDFLVYWAQQIAQGVNIFEEPTQIGVGPICGSQLVLLPKT